MSPLVQLLGARGQQPYDLAAQGKPGLYADLATPAGLRAVARYADGVGPSKDYVVERDGSGASPGVDLVRGRRP